VIDLGNNVRRFGIWQDYLNWQDAFRFPDRFLEARLSETEDLEFEVEFEFPRVISDVVKVEMLSGFNIKEVYYDCVDNGKKGKIAIDLSLDNHYDTIMATAEDYFHGLEMLDMLHDHIEHRLKHYTKCITKSTPNYLKYITETYHRQLRQKLRANLEDE
ncbi:MAG: hypothetical protein ACI865_002973, partial [Flavobacteriaceae bacterium]